LSQLPEKDLFEILGPPESEQLLRLDGQPVDKGLPNQLVRAASWDSWFDEDDEDIRIIDMGETFLQGSEPPKLAQPGPLRAPETIFTDNFDYRIDLWRAGLMVRLCHPRFQKSKLICILADLHILI
jgi:serine/threonine-protein kinase SRPK3